MNKENTILKATVLMTIIAIIAKLLGFLREVVLAYVFGASAGVDAYLVALTLPMVIFTVVGNALLITVVPIFARHEVNGRKKEANKLLGNFAMILMSILIIIIIVCYPLSRQIIWLIAPGLPQATAILATKLLIIMLPGILFFCMASLFSGILNANNIFGPPAVSPALISIFIIIGTIGGMHYGIKASAVGTVVGFVAGMLILIPYVGKTGFRLQWPVDIHDPGMKELFMLMLPIIIGTGISQIYFIIDRFFASGLSEGSIAALNYAFKIILLPQSIIVMALGTAIFPLLSTVVAQGKYEEYSNIIVRALKLMTLVALPCGIALAVLRFPVVMLLFKRGAFDQNAVAMTATALLCFSFGMLGHCLNPILTKGFYADQDMSTPVKVAIVSVLLNLVLSIILIKPLKLGGLALANSSAALFNVVVLFYLLQGKVPALRGKGLGCFVGKTAIASIVGGGLAWWLDYSLAIYFFSGSLSMFIRLLIDSVVGAIAFMLMCRIFRLDEYMYLRNLFLTYAIKIRSGILNQRLKEA